MSGKNLHKFVHFYYLLLENIYDLCTLFNFHDLNIVKNLTFVIIWKRVGLLALHSVA